jgi:hypothetical protein
VRRGGYAFIVTECFVSRHPLNSPRAEVLVKALTLGRFARNARWNRRVVEVFTPREVHSRIIEPSGLELVQPLDLSLSAETRDNIIRASRGRFESATGRPWPHLLLKAHGAAWTSIALPLRKP